MADATDDTIPAGLDGLATADGPLDTMERLLAQVAHAPSSNPPLIEGDRVGRYLLVQRLGAGGMGVVFAAYDPQLDRKVAVKVLRRELGGDTMSARARDRTLREARALAQLVHPNIVGVHDAGYHTDELYIVMELVTGQSLRAWLKSAPRRPVEIARVFRQAAEGLVAAHAAGMVHRDFKPDNVLVGDDGRIRVADFGLVQIAEGSSAGGGDASASGSAELTVTGAFMGTPGYMAPEQLDGKDLDARADQYAFGVSLWQALYGDLPFEQTDLALRRKAQEVGAPPEPAGKRAPGWLRAIVRRAMAHAPDARFPDMATLARAIDRGLGRPRRFAIAASALAIAGVITAAVAFGAVGRPAGDPCASGATEIARVWNPERAAALAAAMPAGAAGAEAASRLRTRLDSYARRWAVAHRTACRATRVDQTQSAQLLDARMACLRRAQVGLDTLVATVIARDVPSAAALPATDRLPSLEQCGDELRQAIGEPWPDDPAFQARVDAVSALVSRGQIDLNGVADDAAIARSRDALARARELGWPPLIAEAAHTLANLLHATEQLEPSLANAREAARTALAAGHDRVAVRTLTDAAVIAGDLGRASEAHETLELGRALAVRLGKDPHVTYELEAAAWSVARRVQRFDDALAAARAALKAADESTDPITRVTALVNLAIALHDAGQRTDAIAVSAEALAARERARGADHPDLVVGLDNHAAMLSDLGRFDEAIAHADRALAITERWYGKDARANVDALLIAAGTRGRAGRLQDAVPPSERALAILAAHGEGESFDYAGHLTNLAIAKVSLGQLDEASADGERVLAILEKLHGPTSPVLGNALVLLGHVARLRGDHEASARHLMRAVRDGEAGLGAAHPDVLNLRNELAHTERARKRFAAAIALYERSLAGPTKDVNPAWLAEAELGLAQALWDGTGDRARARSVAASARDRYAALGDDFAAQRDEAIAWLAARGAP